MMQQTLNKVLIFTYVLWGKMPFFQINRFFYLLIFLPFVPVIWPMGIFQESDWTFFGLWLVAGLYALSFGCNKPNLKISTLPCGLFLLAALSFLGIFQNNLTALGGINEIREGTATFLSLAILIIAGRQHNMKNLPLWLVPMAYSFLTIAGFHHWLHIKTYIFLDISAFPLLASLPLYVNFRKSLIRYTCLWDVIYVAAFLYLLKHCDNVAATVACMCAFIFVFLLPIAKKFIRFLPKKDGWYVVFGLSFIALMILVSWSFFSHLLPQLQSRTLLGIASVLQYLDHFDLSKFLHLLFGYGWGSYQEFPVLNLFRFEYFSMYANGNFKPNWEFLERNLLHTHNLILETLVSSGLIGVGFLLTIIYEWINSIDSKDWAGRFFVVSYLILLSAWFQTPPVLIFSLFAMIFVQENVSYQFKIPSFAWITCGLFLIIFSCTEFWSSIALDKHKFRKIQSFEEDITAFVNDPAHSYDKWSTYKASNWAIGWFLQGLNTITEADTKYLPSVEKAVVLISKDYLDSCQKRNVVSSVHVINMCNTFGNLPKVKISSNSDFFKFFKEAILQHLARFPERADMAIGFLNLCFDKMENIKEVNEIAEVILVKEPEHPIGLWFKGLAGLSMGIDKTQSLEKMRSAVKKGLSRFMPIQKELLQTLGVYQEAIATEQAARKSMKWQLQS